MKSKILILFALLSMASCASVKSARVNFRSLDVETFAKFIEKDDVYLVDGPGAERMLDSVNLFDRDSMGRFQRQLRDKGILDRLRALGATDGDTIRFCDTEFDFVE